VRQPSEIVVINSTAGFYTPTSGALAVWIHSIERVAADNGVTLPIISRSSSEEPYYSQNLHLLPYPDLPGSPILARGLSLISKSRGWTHSREYFWANSVRKTIEEITSGNSVLILHNDPALAAKLSRQMKHCKIIHIFHNMLPCSKAVRYEYAHSSILSMGVSNYMSRWVEKRFSLVAGSVCTLYNGVDLERFHPQACTNVAFCDSCESSKVVVSYCGIMNRNKGTDTLLDSLLSVASSNKDFSVQLIGSFGFIHNNESSDQFTQQLHRQISLLRKQGIEVKIYGYLPWNEIPSQLAKASIQVVPSRWQEPFSLATAEGMACGLATVTSTTGGLPELVGDAGLTFDAGEVSQLARILESLIGNEGLRADLGARARRRAQQFSWQRTWSALCDQIQQLTS